MKTAVDIPDPIFAELKIYAVKQKRKLKDVIVQFLTHGLAEANSKKLNPVSKSKNLKDFIKYGTGLAPTQSSVNTLFRRSTRMNTFCIDASVWLASLNVKETSHSKAVKFLKVSVANNDNLIIPDICLLECVSSLARSGVAEPKALEVELKIRELATTIIPLSNMLQDSLKLAAKLKLRSADSIYAACAKLQKASLITLDLEIIARCSWARLP